MFYVESIQRVLCHLVLATSPRGKCEIVSSAFLHRYHFASTSRQVYICNQKCVVILHTDSMEMNKAHILHQCSKHSLYLFSLACPTQHNTSLHTWSTERTKASQTGETIYLEQNDGFNCCYLLIFCRSSITVTV